MKLGDVDGDGEVTILDLTAAISRMRREEIDSVGQAMRMDVNGDNKLGMADLELMIDYWAGEIETFPAANPLINNMPGAVVNSIPYQGAIYEINSSSLNTANINSALDDLSLEDKQVLEDELSSVELE